MAVPYMSGPVGGSDTDHQTSLQQYRRTSTNHGVSLFHNTISRRCQRSCANGAAQDPRCTTSWNTDPEWLVPRLLDGGCFICRLGRQSDVRLSSIDEPLAYNL